MLTPGYRSDMTSSLNEDSLKAPVTSTETLKQVSVPLRDQHDLSSALHNFPGNDLIGIKDS